MRGGRVGGARCCHARRGRRVGDRSGYIISFLVSSFFFGFSRVYFSFLFFSHLKIDKFFDIDLDLGRSQQEPSLDLGFSAGKGGGWHDQDASSLSVAGWKVTLYAVGFVLVSLAPFTLFSGLLGSFLISVCVCLLIYGMA